MSYASPDRDRVTPYFDRLESRGFDVWMDYRRLKAGQNWDFEIRRALEKAAIIVVFISNNSVDRRGYIQREIKLALHKLEEKLTEDIYIIPVLLDEDTKIPHQIESIHCVKTWESDSYASVEEAVNHQLQAIGAEVRAAQDRSNLSWRQSLYKEHWDGLPGYQLEFNLLHFSSTEYPQVGDITIFLHGQLIAMAMEERRRKFEQTGSMSFGQNKWRRTNTFDAHCSEPVICDNIVSIQYIVHWYGAGAAHPNMFFKTYAFFLDPVVRIHNLDEIFSDKDAALTIIQSAVRKQLLSYSSVEETEPVERDTDWVEKGTENWDSFSAFVFGKEALDLFFSPYQVDCYAAGPQFASIDYKHLVMLMRKEYVEALGIEHFIWTMSQTLR